MEELFGLIVWVIIIVAVSVFRKMKREQQAQQQATQQGGEQSGQTGPNLQDLLRDLGAEVSGTSEGQMAREKPQAAGKRPRAETAPSQKKARDLRSQPTKVERQEQDRWRDKRMRNEPRREEPTAEADLEQIRTMPRRRPRRPAARPVLEETGYGKRISHAGIGDLRQGFIWAEVLGKPVSQREDR